MLGVEALRDHDRSTRRSPGGGVVGPVDLADGLQLGVGDLIAGLVGAAQEHEREHPGDDEAGRDPHEPQVERTLRV